MLEDKPRKSVIDCLPTRTEERFVDFLLLNPAKAPCAEVFLLQLRPRKPILGVATAMACRGKTVFAIGCSNFGRLVA